MRILVMLMRMLLGMVRVVMVVVPVMMMDQRASPHDRRLVRAWAVRWVDSIKSRACWPDELRTNTLGTMFIWC